MTSRGRLAGLLVAVSVLGACGEGPPAVGVEDPPTDDAEVGDVDEVAAIEDRPCRPWDTPLDYTPPPDQQPSAVGDGTDVSHRPDIVTTYPPDGTDAEPVPDAITPDWPEEMIGNHPLTALQTWAAEEAPDHFAGAWIDESHEAFVAAFTDDLDRYADDLRERFGEAWWVVEAEWPFAELEQLAELAYQASPDAGIDLDDREMGGPPQPGAIMRALPDERQAQVRVEVIGGDDEALLEVASRLDHPAYCFELQPE